MTDTGQVPGEGLPENAGGQQEMPQYATPSAPAGAGPSEQPGPMPGSGAYAYPGRTGADDELLMPGAQGAWSDQPPQVPYPGAPDYSAHTPHPGQTGHSMQAEHSVQTEHSVYADPAQHGDPSFGGPVPPQVHLPHQAQPQQPHHGAGMPDQGGYDPAIHASGIPPQPGAHGLPGQPSEAAPDRSGTHETGGRDTGSVDYGSVRIPHPTTPQSAPSAASSAAPTAPATPSRRPLHMGPPVSETSGGVVRSLADRGPAGAPAPRTAGPATVGPEYLDVPREDAPSVPLYAEQPAASLPGPQLGEIPSQHTPWEGPAADSPQAGAAQAAVTAEAQPGTATPPAGTPVDAAGPAPAAGEPGTGAQLPTAAEALAAPGIVPAPDASAAPAAEPAAGPAPSGEQPAPGAAEPSAESPAAEAPEVGLPGAESADPAGPEVSDDPQSAAAGAGAAVSSDGAEETVPEGETSGGDTGATAPDAEATPEAPVGEGDAEAQPDGAPAPVDATPEAAADALATAGQGTAGQGTVGQGFVLADALVRPQSGPGTDPAPTADPAPEADAGAEADAATGADAAAAVEPETAEAGADATAGTSPEAAEGAGGTEAPGAEAGPEGVGGTEAGAETEQPPAPEAETEQAPASEAETEQAPAPEAETEQAAAEAVPDAAAEQDPDEAPDAAAAQEEQPTEQIPADPAQAAEPAADQPAGAPATTDAAAADDAGTPADDAGTPVNGAAPAADSGAADANSAEPAPDAAEPEAESATEGPGDDPEAADDLPVMPGTAAAGYDEAEREAVLRVMRERRDIRNGFRTDPVPHDVLLRVLEAAHTAPSVGHSQPWDFVVIRSAETRQAMHELAVRQREAYAKSLPKGRAKQFKELKIEAILETPVNIVVTADPTRGGRHTLGRHTQPQMAPYSSALAVENLWLAARAEGLGVGWVSFFDEREMVRTLGLPEHLEVVAYLCVGYVDEFPDEPELLQAGWSKRRPLSWVVHEETYGRRALPGEDPHDLLAETLQGIRPLDAKALGEAWERQKRMTKPAGALGMLEIISAQLSGLSRQCPPPIPEPAAVAIFAGDHGVHAQGVTPWPQEVTAQMVANFLGGGAVCNAFANQVGAEVCVVDVGVAGELPKTPGLLPRKVRAGTDDFTAGPALSREDVLRAMEVGIETARDLVAAGNKALLTGEMGIANTTVSAALISVYTGVDAGEVTGRGTGINDETHARKVEVVRRALELHQPDPSDPVGVLAAVGGLEHAALVGLLLGAASLRTPVILDGVSAGAAALLARAIAPEVLAACIAGHRSAEPGHVAALNKLGLRPLVDLDLRLGEGTGALLALPLVQSAARAMHEVATFDAAGVTEKA
ncbi:nicotinate-nucleotide--dimethylbenzimidazole phosphoribosyltransferase [Streptomyces sp. NPDC001922]|uniref:nicotinate-nucleotide--dimethylbenzimidazole phosphoribosyltransferase n=1 Tax=Streptomyces sp. NPDC001922 TaxID=3364624 RepID=UPI0036B59356